MNDVKEICELSLATPAPPLPDSATALAFAKRSTRRRDWFSAAAAVVVVTVAGVAVSIPLLRTPDTTERAPTPVAAPAGVAPVPVPAVPTWEAARDNGPRVTQRLRAAGPAGYTVTPEFPGDVADSGTAVWLLSTDFSRYDAQTSMVVSRDGAQGLLTGALVRDGVAAPAGDLCSAAVAERIGAGYGAGDTCQVMVVDGVPVRVSTRDDPDVGQTIIAIRMLEGGMLAVSASVGCWTFDDVDTTLPPDAVHAPSSHPATAPHLNVLPFTAAQLAALAADPAMLP